MLIAQQMDASTTTPTTPASSVPFPNSNVGSTIGTPATSGEDEEEHHFQNMSKGIIKGTAGTGQKRSAESDDDDSLSVFIKPSKRRATTMKCVEIPARSSNVSAGNCPSSNELSVIDRYRLSREFQG
jgi:hypothetical protein